MKFSEKWLREWIDIKIDSSILYDQISSSGIEIVSIKEFKPIFSGIVVGKIIECIPHPMLNNLKIVKVDIDNKKYLNIVCGASNCRNNIKVAVAKIGSFLPKNVKIDIKIIKGILSEGMLCSFFELGLFINTTKIIEFSKDTPIGIDVYHHLSLQDNIIKVAITPNRPDGLSILGISRNITAINNLKKLPLKKKLIPILTKNNIHVDIQIKKTSISYIGRIIENINVNIDTPFWMKKKLFLSDYLSENIITDIINYVLIETGQPLNALDADHINDHIIIRMADSEEKILLKNNVQINLHKNILVFSDINKILSIPGNINSYKVDVNKNTNNIFLSTFIINKKLILDIIKKIGSNNILEYYNCGVDPFLQNYALEYASELILQICGGKAGPIKKQENLSSNLSKKPLIRLHYKKLNKIFGAIFDASVILNILHHLEYRIIFQEKQYWDVIPPSSRFDILIEEDVISDILRIHGYNSISLTPLLEPLNFQTETEVIDLLLDKSSIILINKGYYEVITYGFVNPKIQDIMFPDKKTLSLLNPISQDMSCMRLSLWPGLLKTVSYNKNRQEENVRFFESGFCFSIDKKENLGVKQEMFLSAVISGNFIQENWYSQKRKVDFYDLKGDLECILESVCGLEDIEFRYENLNNGLHPEQSASVYFQNNFIGSIGAIDPRLEKKIKVNSSTFLFEITLNNFLSIHKKKLKIKEISKFPTIRRDIAILIESNLSVSDIINTCKKFFVHQTVDINLFDVYSCEEFSHTKKSIGISFIFQNQKRTLEENEINLIMNDCIRALKKTFQVVLRK